jgi:hypothetical protein
MYTVQPLGEIQEKQNMGQSGAFTTFKTVILEK